MLKVADISLFESITANSALSNTWVVCETRDIPFEGAVVFNSLNAHINRLLNKTPRLRADLSKNLNQQQLEAVVHSYLQGINTDILDYVKSTDIPNEYLDSFLKLFLREIPITINDPTNKLRKKWYRRDAKRIQQLMDIAYDNGVLMKDTYEKGIQSNSANDVTMHPLSQKPGTRPAEDDTYIEPKQQLPHTKLSFQLPTLALGALSILLNKKLGEDLIRMQMQAQHDGVILPDISQLGRIFMQRLDSQLSNINDNFKGMLKQLAEYILPSSI